MGILLTILYRYFASFPPVFDVFMERYSVPLYLSSGLKGDSIFDHYDVVMQ